MGNNIETVNSIYAAFGRGDIPAILECLSDEVQWEQWDDNSAQRAGVPWMQARQGKAGVIQFFEGLSQLHIRDLQVLAVMGGEHQVAVEVVIDVSIPAAGCHFRDEELHLWTFNASGKVTRMRHYTDTAKQIAAAR